MSLNFATKWMILGLTVGVALGVSDYLNNARYTQKVSLLQQLRPQHTGMMAGKPNQTLNISIQNLDDLPESENQIMRLQVSVKTNRLLDTAAHLRWELPAGVTLIENASLEESVSLIPGQTWTQVVTVQGVSTLDPQVVRLNVSAQLEGASIGGQGIFSSHPLQRDLSRSALPMKKPASYFSKAGADQPAAPKKRLPAGIQF